MGWASLCSSSPPLSSPSPIASFPIPLLHYCVQRTHHCQLIVIFKDRPSLAHCHVSPPVVSMRWALLHSSPLPPSSPSPITSLTCPSIACLGWESRFLVPISGTPIVSRILISFLIPKILVGFFFGNSNVWRVRKSEF
jgi:hypothetical protein